MPSSTGRSPYHGSSFRSRVVRNSLLNMDSSFANANANRDSDAAGSASAANAQTNASDTFIDNTNASQSQMGGSHIFSPNFEHGMQTSTTFNGRTNGNINLDVSNAMNFSPNFSSARLSFGSNVNGNGNDANTNPTINTNANAGRRKSMRSSRVRSSLGSASYTAGNVARSSRNSNASTYMKNSEDRGNNTGANSPNDRLDDLDSSGKNKKNPDLLLSELDQHDDPSQNDHDDGNGKDQQHQQHKDPNAKLRKMIHNLLHNHRNNSTPSPASAVFYASILYTKTTSPQDAYLFATALLANQEKRRTIFVLEKAGLLSFEALRNGIGSAHSGEREHVRLIIEAMLLASDCYGSFGEWDEVTALLEGANDYRIELMLEEVRESKFLEGRMNQRESLTENSTTAGTGSANIDGEYQLEQGLETGLRRLAQYLYTTLDECDINPVARLCLMRGKACDEASNPSRSAAFLKLALGIDVKCIDAWTYLCRRRLMTSNEEVQLVVDLRLDDLEPEMEWLKDIFYARLSIGDFGNADVASGGAAGSTAGICNDNGIQLTNIASPITSASMSTPMNMLPAHGTPQSGMLDASSIQFQRTPSNTFNFNNSIGMNTSQTTLLGENNSNHVKKQVEESFQNLHFKHNLSQSPEVLALAATRAYNAYNLSLALHYCQVLYEMDPLSVNAAGIQIATLTGMGHKRPLFRLAHALVDADPKSPTAWYAVGCYYYACGRYDLAQQHYWRATRLGPRNANCWVAFGCAFAACDENDQANACFRTAQRLNSGSHYPMLYMGMEHLRTNNIPLAGHFLKSSRSMEQNDPLCCNELGVWAYRNKEWMDGIHWFVLALRLYAESVISEKSILSWTEEDLKEEEAEIGTKVNKPRFEFGQRQGRDTVHSFTDTDCVEFCQDAFWEPAIFNLGQCYRKARMYEEASLCFQKSVALCPEKPMSYSALGFTRHLAGDIDEAIESYHQALSRKPDDPFASEMLNRAMRESLDMGSIIIPVEGDVSFLMHDARTGTSRSQSNLEGSPFSLGDSDVSMSC